MACVATLLARGCATRLDRRKEQAVLSAEDGPDDDDHDDGTGRGRRTIAPLRRHREDRPALKREHESDPPGIIGAALKSTFFKEEPLDKARPAGRRRTEVWTWWLTELMIVLFSRDCGHTVTVQCAAVRRWCSFVRSFVSEKFLRGDSQLTWVTDKSLPSTIPYLSVKQTPPTNEHEQPTHDD